jgi:hypothetical protein
MRIHRTFQLRRLHLETPERAKLALSRDDLLDRCRPEGADQLVFEVRAASVEPEALRIGSTRRRRRQPCRYRAQKVTFFRNVVQARQPQPKPVNPETDRKLVRVRGAPDGQNDDSHGCEVESDAPGQGLNRGLITPAFDEHDRVGLRLGDEALRVIEAERRAWPVRR